jgi:excisionase family DNA binding protein
LLREPLRQRIAELERSGRVHPEYVRQLRAAYGEIVAAGELWQERRVSVDGSTKAAVTEIGSSSWQPEELSPEEASVLLDVSPSRVRQLLRSGALEGRRVGRSWLVSRAAAPRSTGKPERLRPAAPNNPNCHAAKPPTHADSNGRLT